MIGQVSFPWGLARVVLQPTMPLLQSFSSRSAQVVQGLLARSCICSQTTLKTLFLPRKEFNPFGAELYLQPDYVEDIVSSTVVVEIANADCRLQVTTKLAAQPSGWTLQSNLPILDLRKHDVLQRTETFPDLAAIEASCHRRSAC